MALIYIVEDDTSIREIEEISLKSAGHKVVGFERASELFEQLEKILPDLFIVDVMLPDMNGNDIVKSLRKTPETRNAPIIMVTAKTTDFDLARGFDDGADDYIKKPFTVMELISRVKALLRRANTQEHRLLALDGLTLEDDKHEVRIDGTLIELTYKEYELLSLLLLNKGIVLSRDRIMEHIWGIDYECESRTLDMHIKTLRQKLGEYGARIKTVRNVGYEIV